MRHLGRLSLGILSLGLLSLVGGIVFVVTRGLMLLGQVAVLPLLAGVNWRMLTGVVGLGVLAIVPLSFLGALMEARLSTFPRSGFRPTRWMTIVRWWLSTLNPFGFPQESLKSIRNQASLIWLANVGLLLSIAVIAIAVVLCITGQFGGNAALILLIGAAVELCGCFAIGCYIEDATGNPVVPDASPSLPVKGSH